MKKTPHHKSKKHKYQEKIIIENQDNHLHKKEGQESQISHLVFH